MLVTVTTGNKMVFLMRRISDACDCYYWEEVGDS